MKELKAEQREYMTMIGLLNEYVSPCPHGKRSASSFSDVGVDVIRIGSTACQMCPHFKGIDYKSKIVKCCLE